MRTKSISYEVECAGGMRRGNTVRALSCFVRIRRSCFSVAAGLFLSVAGAAGLQADDLIFKEKDAAGQPKFLSGVTVSGITESELISAEGKRFPRESVLALRFERIKMPPAMQRIILTDGSIFSGFFLERKENVFRVRTICFGEMEFKMKEIAGLALDAAFPVEDQLDSAGQRIKIFGKISSPGRLHRLSGPVVRHRFVGGPMALDNEIVVVQQRFVDGPINLDTEINCEQQIKINAPVLALPGGRVANWNASGVTLPSFMEGRLRWLDFNTISFLNEKDKNMQTFPLTNFSALFLKKAQKRAAITLINGDRINGAAIRYAGDHLLIRFNRAPDKEIKVPLSAISMLYFDPAEDAKENAKEKDLEE